MRVRKHHDAYDRLILDVINGNNRISFETMNSKLRGRCVIRWFLQLIADMPMTTYSYGSRGPKEADELRTRAGHLPSHLVEKDSVPLLNAEYDTLPGERRQRIVGE